MASGLRRVGALPLRSLLSPAGAFSENLLPGTHKNSIYSALPSPQLSGSPWCLGPSILLSVLTHLGISSFFVTPPLFVRTVGWSHLCLRQLDFLLMGFGRPPPPPQWTGWPSRFLRLWLPSQTARCTSSVVRCATRPTAALYLVFPSATRRWWWGHLVRMLGGFKKMSTKTQQSLDHSNT